MFGQMNFPFMKGNQVQRCPDCDGTLTADAINIKEGVALCPGCGSLTRLSELNYSDRSIEDLLNKPPHGCSTDFDGQGVVVTASLRSVGGFLATAGFALFWNGIISIFMLVAVTGLYINLIGPLPAWFPAPGLKNGKPEMNGQPMNLGETLFLCVFLIPFVAIGTAMVGAALMNLFGKVEVVIDELNSYVATGIGFVKWRTRFDPNLVRNVKFGTSAWQSEGKTSKLIELSADRPLKFGSMLQADRMEWMWAVLKTVFCQKSNNNRHGLTIPKLSWLKS